MKAFYEKRKEKGLSKMDMEAELALKIGISEVQHTTLNVRGRIGYRQMA